MNSLNATNAYKNGIRRFAYAALLAFTTLNFAPSLASGQETARGTFTLTHDVRWGTATIPAGDYHFSMGSEQVSQVVTLSELNHARLSFMLLVKTVEESKPTDSSRLVLQTARDGSSYVSAMHLPEFGMTLYFGTPSRSVERQIAKAGLPAAAIGQ